MRNHIQLSIQRHTPVSVLKSTVITALAVFAMTSSAHAQFSDSFDYSDGTDYATNGGYVGDVLSSQFNASGLDSTLLTGETGGRISVDEDRIKHTLGDTFGDENETLYVSYLYQSSDNRFSENGSFDVLELHIEPTTITNGDGNRTYNIGLLRSNGDEKSGFFEHNIDTGDGATVSSGDLSPSLGAFNTGTNLLVARFDFTNGGNDFEVNAWLNPASTSVITGTNATITGTGLDFNTFGFASFVTTNSGGNANFDEVRFSSTAEGLNLAVIPEPSTALLALIGMAGFGLLYMRRRAL